MRGECTMVKSYSIIITVLLIFCLFITAAAQEENETDILSASTFSGVKFRSIGPALMSGRIADIAMNPKDNNTWYVAVGSGGVWKTTNSGTTWQPLFDEQSSYSIGCVTIDSKNPHIVWVGTGENVGGRHVGYGDGIYKSMDGGKSWENKGLKESQHISKILIHPKNSDIILVAAQGPLWNKGGERGLYKSTDGGETWKKILGDDEWVGVTDIVSDPRDPNRLYAATWQRHRNVAAYMGGGPGSGLHKSEDGGETWTQLKSGLPNSNMGKIGLAISPQQPDILYAAIELDRRKGGVYKSNDRGVSWVKQSDAVSGATGPHYYQELVASPHKFDRIYLIDVRIQISDDGGKNFRNMTEQHKHSDNHALVFRKDDPNYYLAGTDGGIYESFDAAKNWKYIANLPVTQFYKVALDDKEPFYTIYGGTQDNATQGGPSRTDNLNGITNRDWFVTLWGDGHQPATEPGNPDIIYSEWQEGNLVRVDRKTGEIVYIQPQPGEGEGPERFNWDSPILVSPHDPKRIYFASQRVWRSDDRGDSWKAISGDLTKNQNRIELPIMGGKQSWDNPWDMLAMSTYSTITSLAESPLQDGLMYAGTDDGYIQVTEDGGSNWKKIDVNQLPGVPATAFINDIKADLHDVNTVYVVLDNHKFGDLNPYIYKSSDKGNSWESITNNIPNKTLVWRVVQDHVNPKLLFAATEFGIYFTFDGGFKWIKFSGGLPTISFRDLAIQKRENDLVGASFGRSFYVLDDYSFLREVSKEQLNKEATLFPTRKALWYIPRPDLSFGSKGSQGAGYFSAENPPFGAVFTYYLKDSYKTQKDVRKENEKELSKNNKDIPFPGWDKVEQEHREEATKIWLTVRDDKSTVIKRIEGKSSKGFHRVAWNLNLSSTFALSSNGNNFEYSMMVGPGTYSVQLSKEINGVVTNLSEPMEFIVEKMRDGTLKGSEPDILAKFWKDLAELRKETSAADLSLKNALKKVDVIKKALVRSNAEPGGLDKELFEIKYALHQIDEKLNGKKSKGEIGELGTPTISKRIRSAETGTMNATYGPTPTHIKSFEIAVKEFDLINKKLDQIVNVEIPRFEEKILKLGAPYIR